MDKVLVIAASCGLHFTVFNLVASLVVNATRANANGAKPDSLARRKSLGIQFGNYAGSLTHATCITLFALSEMLRNPWMLSPASGLHVPSSPSFQYACCFLIGYMLYDLHVVTMYPETFSRLHVVHHAVAMAGAGVGLAGLYPVLILPFFLTELPVVFIDLCVMAQLAGPAYARAASALNHTAFALFVVFRLGAIPLLMPVLLQHIHSMDKLPNKPCFCLLTAIFALLSVMNVYWVCQAATATFGQSSVAVSQQPFDGGGDARAAAQGKPQAPDKKRP